MHGDSREERPLKKGPPLEERLADEARFLKTWLESPLLTGAVSPSGRALARMMARPVEVWRSGPVVELGPGTGPVTEALIRKGIAQDRLILVEYDPTFCKLLARRYPRALVIQGDAYALADTLRGHLEDKAAAIVSSLPLLNRPERNRLRLIADAFALLQRGAPFIQFTYGLASPIPRRAPAVRPFSAEVSPSVWLNLPPARVWTYRAAPVEAEAQGDLEPAEAMPFVLKLKSGTELLGEELRERGERLREGLRMRAARARAELRVRAEKVKIGLGRTLDEKRRRARRKRAVLDGVTAGRGRPRGGR